MSETNVSCTWEKHPEDGSYYHSGGRFCARKEGKRFRLIDQQPEELGGFALQAATTLTACKERVAEFFSHAHKGPFWVVGEDLAPGAVGPFATYQDAEAHVAFQTARGDAACFNGTTFILMSLPEKYQVNVCTPQQDRDLYLPDMSHLNPDPTNVPDQPSAVAEGAHLPADKDFDQLAEEGAASSPPTTTAGDGVYDEIHQPNTFPYPAFTFPDACPVCSAPATHRNEDGPHYGRFCEYVCGGKYTNKPQIQNHTNKWWGHCSRPLKAQVECTSCGDRRAAACSSSSGIHSEVMPSAEQRTARPRKSRAKAKVEEMKSMDLVGEVIAWSIRTGATHTFKDVQKALADNDLDTEVARALLPRYAFDRACKSLEKERSIDRVKEDGDSITFQFTRKWMETAEIKFSKETNLTINKITGKVTCPDANLQTLAQSEVDRCLEARTSSDITMMVQRLFERRNGDLFPIRDQGGAWLVLQEDIAFASQVQSFLKQLGGKMNRLPVPAGTQHGDLAIQDIVAERMAKDISDHEAAIENFTTSTRPSTLEAAAERIKETRVKIEARANYLRERAGDLLQALEDANTRLAAQVAALSQARIDAPPAPGTAKPGVIAAMIRILKSATEVMPVTKEEVLKQLVELFPERDRKAMASTISSQIPSGLKKEKNIDVQRNTEGYWIA